MYYSEDIIEEVRQSNDIVEVISSYVRLQKKGSNYGSKKRRTWNSYYE